MWLSQKYSVNDADSDGTTPEAVLCKKWKFTEAKVFAPVAKQIRIRISSKSARSCVVVSCTNAQILSSSHNRAAKFYQEILSEGHFVD